MKGQKMKTIGVPFPITVILLLLAVAGAVVGVMAILGSGPEDFMNPAWGGRSLGLSVLAAAVIWMKEIVGYLALLVASIVRELADLAQLMQAETFNWGLGLPAIVLLVIWLLGFAFVVQGLIRTSQQSDTAT